MIRKKLFLMIVFIILCSIHAIAQTDCYYYYQGQKIPLTLNENKVCISIPKDCKETSERIRTNVQVLSKFIDEIFDIFVITRSDFEKLTSLDSWKKDVKSVIVTPNYWTTDADSIYVGSDVTNTKPYGDVVLGQGDITLKAGYVEIKNSTTVPLGTTLTVDAE